MRSTSLLIAALVSSAFAKIAVTTDDPSARLDPKTAQPTLVGKDATPMNLGQISVRASSDNPMSQYILEPEAYVAVGLRLDRSFVDAIQGNMDREATEQRNSENR